MLLLILPASDEFAVISLVVLLGLGFALLEQLLGEGPGYRD